MFKIFGNKVEAENRGVFADLVYSKTMTPQERRAEAQIRARAEVEKIGLERNMSPAEFKETFGFSYSAKSLNHKAKTLKSKIFNNLKRGK